ncbi:poly-beta-1,6-N-acetyl-D-glucosamine biosynthesis protein PgaD [Acinetobacter larvae]|uniref:Poly-beta-1,6-N-acetyl-D-glucosamine biosynthesis protein PgaD n=1 Tax=Acinetobacter larvae TaxID=1789224 RepID=A0A1B2LYX1_9GAMM|nr:poly-beta-1,6-N-acetyl-D-glucosamine biosynthesis protein PgaD [Acinetobacter larvae]AOA58137.1 poly-beta-1,6-N-acetyl-D-glucosamine biosynthesis protein PgaD [Acinetobacter larvae]
MTIPQQEYQLIEDESLLDIPQYIDKPHYVKNKLAGYSLQVVGWTIFMLILLPVATLFLWWFEITTIQHYIFIDYSSARMDNLVNISLLILCCGLILILWACYNWLRFSHMERRFFFNNISAEQFVTHFDINIAQYIQLKTSHNLTLYYDQFGKLYSYDVNDMS